MTVSQILMILGFLMKFTVVYFIVIAVRGMFIAPKIYESSAAATRFAVVIAARNEQAVIGRLVKSLYCQSYPRELYDVYVVPNNCTDETELRALENGAKVLHCDEPVHCKGDALRQAFIQLEDMHYNAYVVFDADNVVHRDYLKKTNDAIRSGAQVVKGRQIALNPRASWVAGCYDLYFAGFDLFYNLPRANAGLSVKLVGTGFAVASSALRLLGGWNTETIAEDAEFAAQCAGAGIQVVWAPEAITYDEEPESFLVSLRQRKRWCSGVIQVGRSVLPKLMLYGTGRLSNDMMIFLLTAQLAPISFLFMISARLVDKTGAFSVEQLFLTIAVYWIAGMALAFFLQIKERTYANRNLLSIGLFPVFMVSWIPLQILGLFFDTTVWKEIVHSSDARSS